MEKREFKGVLIFDDNVKDATYEEAFKNIYDLMVKRLQTIKEIFGIFRI